MRYRAIWLAVFSVGSWFAFAGGCVPVLPVEPTIGVSGTIVDKAGRLVENCQLTAFPQAQAAPYAYIFTQKVKSRFEITFGHVQPGASYRVVIECVGDEPVARVFRAEPSDAKEGLPYLPVDLGMIRVGVSP